MLFKNPVFAGVAVITLLWELGKQRDFHRHLWSPVCDLYQRNGEQMRCVTGRATASISPPTEFFTQEVMDYRPMIKR